MIVANSTPTSNPKLTDQAKTAREAIEAIDTVTAEIKQVLMDAVATSASFDNTERIVRELVLRIGYQAMSTFVALQGDGDLGTVDPHVRTAEDVTEALFRDEIPEDEPKTKRPKPQNKNTTAHFPEVEEDGVGGTLAISGIHVAMAWLIGQVVARRRPGQVLIVLMDGQESLWETLKLHLSFSARTVPILDILHALSYIWKAAKLFTKTDVARRAFTRQRLLRILRGEVRGVIRGLRRMGTMQDLSGESLKELTRICGYLEKNADRMRYDEYLRRGYPIASGVIEGACRHLVKDRMERSGMRWTLEGARSMLHVRSVFQSDHWRTFLDHRIHQEVTRIHRHRKLIGNYQPITLAC